MNTSRRVILSADRGVKIDYNSKTLNTISFPLFINAFNSGVPQGQMRAGRIQMGPRTIFSLVLFKCLMAVSAPSSQRRLCAMGTQRSQVQLLMCDTIWCLCQWLGWNSVWTATTMWVSSMKGVDRNRGVLCGELKVCDGVRGNWSAEIQRQPSA